MKTLGTELMVQDRLLRQVKRQGNVALYLICSPEPESRKKFLGYELTIIQVKKVKGGSEEWYPLPNQKPKQSWHYDMSERHWAEKGFDALVERERTVTMPFAATPFEQPANVHHGEVDCTFQPQRFVLAPIS